MSLPFLELPPLCTPSRPIADIPHHHRDRDLPATIKTTLNHDHEQLYPGSHFHSSTSHSFYSPSPQEGHSQQSHSLLLQPYNIARNTHSSTSFSRTDSCFSVASTSTMSMPLMDDDENDIPVAPHLLPKLAGLKGPARYPGNLPRQLYTSGPSTSWRFGPRG